MQSLSYGLLFTAALSFIYPIIGMGAFALVTMPGDKQVLVLGDHHNYAELKARFIATGVQFKGHDVSEDTIISLLKKVPPKQRLTLIGELSDNYFAKGPKDQSTEPFFEKIMAECRALLEQGNSPLLFIPCDPRSIVSDMVSACYNWMGDTILEYTSGEEIEAYNGKLEGVTAYHAQPASRKKSFTERLRTYAFKKNLYNQSVGDFFAYLDQCLTHIKSIEAKYRQAEKQAVVAVIHDQTKRFIQAQAEIAILLKDIPLDTFFPNAFKSLFIGDESVNFRMNLIKKCTELFLNDTDYLYADVCFLEKAVDTLEHHNRVAFAMGAKHLTRLVSMLEQLGGNVPLSDDILAAELPLNNQYQLSPQHDTKLLLAISQFLQTGSDEPAEDAAIHQCFHCFKQGASNVCRQCKKARYCSAVCQTFDWQRHKRCCKKSE